MEDLKQIVAENITRLRTAANLTQAELGAMVNYSDKSISKWERGDAIPDVRVPVSYTHLDVYKRQLLDCALDAPAKNIAPQLPSLRRVFFYGSSTGIR